MADIFSSRNGMVTVLADPDGALLPGAIYLERLETVDGATERADGAEDTAWTADTVLFSGLDYTQEANSQFQLSLDESVYVYVFGDRMGDLVINGIAFAGMCDEQSEGVLEVLDYYAEHRMAVNPLPLAIKIGSGDPIYGFLLKVSIKMVGSADNPATLGMHRFTLLMKTLPENVE
jgi:hypothetical protein